MRVSHEVDHRAYPVGWGMRCTRFEPGAGKGREGAGGLWTFDGHLMITILLPLIIMIMIMIDFIITISSIIATIITITGDDGDNGEV